MVTNSRWIVKVLGGVVGVNLTLALAVSAGAVPHPGADNHVSAASVEVEELAAPARQPGDGAAPAQVETPAAAAVTPDTTPTTAAPATTVAKPKTTKPPTTKAPVAKAAPTTAAPAVAAPAAPVAAAVTKVARRVPTNAEVTAAINELKRQVGGLLNLFPPTPAHIAQAGEQVCTAFDNGQTFAQVKATGLSMIPASVTVTAATAEWAVRQAVALYCPGHANKLV